MSTSVVADPPAPTVLGADGIARLVDALADSGRLVVGPVVHDGVIGLGPITTAADLPRGWRDEQGPGRYRATATDERTWFGYATTARPWKAFVHPERTLLIRSQRNGRGVDLETAPDAASRPLAFFGIRSCDLAALDRLGVVLEADEGHMRRRADLAVVAVACTTAAPTCFCASTGTGPRPGEGADVVLTEVAAEVVIATAHTELGRALLDRCDVEPASAEVVATAERLVDACADTQVRQLDDRAAQRAAEHPDDPGWVDIAERCLTCGNCTMVCPTCFCTTVEDRTSVTDDRVERWQRWDSCFALDFSHLHGGAVRRSASSRYRQWYLHKLVTWHDQFGSSGCVGCGRCITWCPTGIDITEAVVR